MSSQVEATAAIEALNSTEFGAEPRPSTKPDHKPPAQVKAVMDMAMVVAEDLATNAAAASKTNNN